MPAVELTHSDIAFLLDLMDAQRRFAYGLGRRPNVKFEDLEYRLAAQRTSFNRADHWEDKS